MNRSLNLRRLSLVTLWWLCGLLFLVSHGQAQTDPLPSWKDGAAKQAIVEFVQATSTQGSPNFVPPEQRIATFDQDGTLWVEHPMYTQVVYCLERVRAVVKAKPELAKVAPFKTVISGNREAMAKLTMKDLEKILVATLTGMSVEEFDAEVKAWLATAKDPRWKRPYTDLTYQPMLEVLNYLRANGYKTYIVTGGGQDFVRVYSEEVYGIPPEQVVGTAGGTKYGYGKDGKPFLTKEPKLLLNDNSAGKPEGIHLMIGRRPYAAFGNSTGDQQMLEYTKAGGGMRLAMLVLHDDAKREYAYGPALRLPNTKVGTFTQALYDEAKKQGWVVISMKNDWTRIFPSRSTSSASPGADCGSGTAAALFQSRNVVHKLLDGHSPDVLRQREGVITCVQNIQPMQCEVMQRDVSRPSQFRRHGSLDLKSEASTAAHNQQIEFGSGMGGPEEALMMFGTDPADQLFDHEALPRCPRLGVGFDIGEGPKIQQSMQQAAISHVDFGRTDLALADVFVPRWKLPNHKGRDQTIQVPPDGRIGHSEGTRKLRGIPNLPVIVREHGPESPQGRRADGDAELGQIAFEKRLEELPPPFEARRFGDGQIRTGKTAPTPQLEMVWAPDFIQREARKAVIGNASG